MATGITIVRSSSFLPEQILALFGIPIDDTNKAICPFHEDDNPSLQVNQEYVYCYGCKRSFDGLGLADELLKKQGTFTSTKDTLTWLRQVELPSPTNRTYVKTKYRGAVSDNLITYWQQCLLNDPDRIQDLQNSRLLTLDTIQHFRLGWRPDHMSYVIPFLHYGIADIVQFRSTRTTHAKYYGLNGHQRGSIMNWDILDNELEYVVVLLGAFDATLAWQDGLPAVGLNGSMPFKKTEKARVHHVFEKAKLKFIVPDNTQSEYQEAERLARWIDADVRYFDEDLTPPDCDYIDYRRMGKTVDDFKVDVLNIQPDYTFNPDFIDNLHSLYKTGDQYNLMLAHCYLAAKGRRVVDIAVSLAQRVDTIHEKRKLLNVRCEEELVNAFSQSYYAQGGW